MPSELHPAEVTTAQARGEFWASSVARRLTAQGVELPQSWPVSPKALARAYDKVLDLGDTESRPKLARACNEAAARRYEQIRHPPAAFAAPNLDDELPR